MAPIKTKWIPPYRRRNLRNKSQVAGHFKKINVARRPKPAIMKAFTTTFEKYHSIPLSTNELSHAWRMNTTSAKRHLQELEKKKKIKMKIINGKVYWIKE